MPCYSGWSQTKPVGMTLAQISLGTRKVKEEIHFLKGMKGLVLSWKTVQKLGIIPPDYPKQINAVSDANGNRSCAGQPCRELFEGQTTKTVISPIASKIPRPVAFKAKTPPVANLTKDDLIKEFPEVFDGKVRVMPSETFKIELTDDAKPYCVTNPRPVPFAYKEPLKKELDKLQAAGIITPVSKPTNWCLHSVVAPKKNVEIRLCVDFRPLNKFDRCEHYQMTSPATAVADIEASQAKIFTTLDALKGHHQCPLDVDSQELTTFITPYGRFQFLSASSIWYILYIGTL